MVRLHAIMAVALLSQPFPSQPLMAQTGPDDYTPPPAPPASDTQMAYYDRHKIDISNLRDLYDGLLMADALIHGDAMFAAKTKWEMTLFQMIRLGSNHYQARSAYQLALMGVSIEDIQRFWSPDYLETIADPRLKAAYTYLSAISSYPATVTADTHALLRTHYTDRQIAELFELAGINAPLARHDQILPIPTDPELLAWASQNLAGVGWKPGANASSSPEEQRARSFTGSALKDAYAEVVRNWRPADLAATDPEFDSDWINFVTGYGVSTITFDGDQDGVEEPFDGFPEDYTRWKKPEWDTANQPAPTTPAFNVGAYDFRYYRPPVVPKTQYKFSDRHKFDTEWTRLVSMGTAKIESHFSFVDRAMTMEEKWPIFLVFQLSSGCVHCQSHGAFGFYDAVEDDYAGDEIPASDRPAIMARLHALFDFERSDLFTAKEKAAYRLARDAGSWPTRTTPAHIEELRRHYSDREIQEIIETIIAGSWLASDMQSQLTVTDRLAMSWALRNLTEVGWRPGAHLGRPNEMRSYHMTEMADFAMAKMNSGQVIDQVSEWVGVPVPLGIDSDADGVEDGYDGFPDDPSRWADTDRDGLEDSADPDIDGDGIANADEVAAGTFPYKADSDGDGVDDLREREAGTDPVDPADF